MGILANDLPAIYADTALTVPVVYGAQQTRGFLKQSDVLEQTPDGTQIQRRATTVLIQTTALTGLTIDGAITVDGASYRLRFFDRIGDGSQTRLMIAEVVP